jgi:phosphoglycolate phosphatase-like HAD superfamily hydrolase
MMELAHQVELRGGKPLEPLTYKRMYHEKLMANIEYRRQDLRRGAVPPEKYLVPGARAFLESLRDRGLKLYCASGTDEVYTLEEAGLLEVRQFFQGGIFGAQDDYKSFSKEILIQRMISGLECKGDELVGFGDGFVEIKNVKDVGGIAVGLATAEPECQVVDVWKRQRLMSVGADFIVPNFLPREELLQKLFPNS